MRILTKKAFCFEKREVKDGQTSTLEKFETKPMIFTEAPDWIKNDPIFTWALQDGDIEILQTVKKEKKVENEAEILKPSNKVGKKAEKELNKEFGNKEISEGEDE